MKLKVMVLVCLGMVALILPNWGTAKAEKPRWISHEIMIDGPALFYAVQEDIRHELWSVHCSQPLRGCVARAPGLALRMDRDLQPWLMAVAGPRARVSLQQRNFTQDIPGIFSTPLAPDLQTQLSRPDSFIVIEEQGQVVSRTRTEGLRQVVSYLRWVNGATARTLRDARLWPGESTLDPARMTPEVLERYEVMQRRRKEGQRQLVPSTKPQIEFAIQAQGGSSYYSATGQAGY
jgi:hypothetical protein